jgi:hypothetical protein
MLTETQLKIILILLDNNGHAEWELAAIMKMKTSNLNPILKKLEDLKIIYQGDRRDSQNKRKRHQKGDYKEIPYYLTNDLEYIKVMIREIIESNLILDTGFVLEVIKKSAYIKEMAKKFGSDFAPNIAGEIRANYSPYIDQGFSDILNILKNGGLSIPFLEGDWCGDLDMIQEKRLEMNYGKSSLKRWYTRYLRRHRDQV